MAVKVRKGGAWVDVSGDIASGTTQVARIYEAKAHNTGAGSPADTAYYDRILNTKDDPQSIVTWPAGASTGTGGTNTYFSLAAGSYKISWRCPANSAQGFRSRLVYANNSSFTSSSEVLGESGISQDSGFEPNNYNCGTAILTTTETIYFKIQQALNAGGSGATWGNACAVGGDEIYTQVFVEDLATAVKKDSVYIPGNSKVAFIEHREDSSVGDLPAFTQNAWVTRELTHKIDPNGMVTFPVATDSATDKTQFSLGAGSYRIKWGAPAVRCDRHQSKLVYATNSSFTSPTTVYGSSEIIENGENLVGTRSLGETVLTLTATTWFKIQQIVDGPATGGAASSKGFNTAGVFSGVTDPPTWSVYTQVSIEDLATAVKNDGTTYIKQIQHASGPATQTSYNSGTWTTIVEKSITLSEDNKVLINVKAGFYGGSEGTAYQGGRIVRTTSASDSTVLDLDSIWGRVGAGTNFKASIDGPTYEESPGVGTHTYKWQTRQHNAANSNDIIVWANGNSITLTEIVN